MKRGAPKKGPSGAGGAGVERRKTPRGKSQGTRKAASTKAAPKAALSKAKAALSKAPSKARTGSSKAPGASAQAGTQDHCYHCNKDLGGSERALFVEEEVGRVFCSEPCITGYFGPEIERLEKEYLRRLSPGDLTGEERESLAHLRFITLQEPDEVWREKTLTGDYRYTLVSEFEPGNRKVWSICICLFLRGEPSFLFIAFATRNEAMVNAYRRGERMQWDRPRNQSKTNADGTRELISDEGDEAHDAGPSNEAPSDRLADAWTEDETFLAQMSLSRSPQDIPPEDFEHFQGCLEETLETPDEVWSLEMAEPEGVHLYHFIRHYPEKDGGHWYVILARETDNEEQIEILDAFPTRDASLVDRYRRGNQEVGDTTEARPVSRLVH
jgi:hypothetical protein